MKKSEKSWKEILAELEALRREVVDMKVAYLQDITERKLAEERIRRLNRAMAVCAECIRVLIHATEETKLLYDVCRIAVEVGGYRMAWIGYPEQDEARTVRPVAQAGFENGYLQSVNITWADAERGGGPTGTAIRTGEPCVARNITTEPDYGLWRADALQHGYASSIALPLVADGGILGALNIYASEPDAFDTEEEELLKKLADNLAYGIHTLRLRVDLERMDNGLRDSENKYRMLFDNLPDAAFLADTETGKIIDANRQAEVLLGRSHEEIVSMYQSELYPPAKVEKYNRLFEESSRLERVLDVEAGVAAKDGTVIPVSITARTFTLQRQPVIIGVFQNILERREMKETLQDVTRRLRLALQSSNIGLWDWDLETNYVYFSPEWKDILGYAEDEIENRYEEWESRLHDDDREYVLAVLRSYIEGGLPEGKAEFRLRHKDGSYRWIYAQGELQRDNDGIPRRMLGCHIDITGRKEAEELLRESEEKYRYLVENLTVGIAVISPQMEILSLNPRMKKWFPHIDVNQRPICYRSFNQPPREEICSYCPTYKTLVDGQTHEAITETPMGTEARNFRVVSSPLRERSGEIVGAIEMVDDVTELKRAEINQRENAERLQRMMDGTIKSITSAFEMRDPYTAGHQRRVAQLACAIGKAVGFPEDRVEGLRIAGYLHDIGKIAVPAEILSKPGKISEAEFSIIKTHPQFGYEILKEIEFFWPVALATLQHHERMDGSGYPQGLSGEQIILEARILAVADVVEAVSSHRPYRPALGVEVALKEISENKGTLYDTQVVEACERQFTKKGFRFD